MKTKKLFAVMAAAAMCVSMVTGFGGRSVAAADDEVTVDSLLNGHYAATEDVESTSYKLSMDMDMSMTIFGFSQNLDMEIAMDIQTCDGITYVSGHMSNSSVQDGEEEITEQDVEQYIEPSDGKYAVYSLNTETGIWSKWIADELSFAMDAIPRFNSENFTLEEGSDRYIVKGSLDILETLQALPNMFEDLPSMFGGFGELSGEADITYTFDKETKELKEVKIDMARALQDLIDKSMEEAIASLAETLGNAETEEEFDAAAFFSADFRSLSFEITDLTFNQEDEIVIPDEAREAKSIDEEEGAAPDGTATLPSGFAG